MKTKTALGIGFLSIAIAVTGTSVASAAVTITKVYDGDTITLSTGERVRFLQIDTPELSPAECYGQEARSVLVNLLNTPGQLSLRNDPKLDQVDRYGRLLRYIFIGNTNINLKMVELGAAAPYFYKGDKGKYATQILQAAKNAKAKSLGLWKSCPGTQLTPNNAVTAVGVASTASAQTTPVGTNAIKCDPNYAGCIPVYPPDLDCTDIKRLGLAPVKVIGKDVHKLDRDGNGVGCDS
jgi:endonuclease YncB( thermonuclease family)